MRGAVGAQAVAPLFVLDPRVLDSIGAANRVSFLLTALRELRLGLRDRLVLRIGALQLSCLADARENALI